LEENNSRLLNFFLRKRNWVAVTKTVSRALFPAGKAQEIAKSAFAESLALAFGGICSQGYRAKM
jgi:hypothetical protein